MIWKNEDEFRIFAYKAKTAKRLLRQLAASTSFDGEHDGKGFSRDDDLEGCELAALRLMFTPKQFDKAKALCYRYRRQLNAKLVAVLTDYR
jgi:hypothetical protein